MANKKHKQYCTTNVNFLQFIKLALDVWNVVCIIPPRKQNCCIFAPPVTHFPDVLPLGLANIITPPISYYRPLTTFDYLTVVDAVFDGWQFAQLDVIQPAAYCICAVGFALNALPSNWSERVVAAMGVMSRDNASSEGIVLSLYQRARRATSTHLPWRHRRSSSFYASIFLSWLPKSRRTCRIQQCSSRLRSNISSLIDVNNCALERPIGLLYTICSRVREKGCSNRKT